MANILVTGATGFIGTRLVHHLSERGDRVTCLVRAESNRRELESVDPRFVVGDLTDESSIRQAVSGAEFVFNLAGTTKALHRQAFDRANVDGARLVAKCCARPEEPPVLIHVSSLAAAGPSQRSAPRTEADDAAPISDYGKSKLAGEIAVREFADRLPISIIRPPIVLGPGDRDGFEMFRGIAKWNLHLVPGFTDNGYSVIHVDDLCRAMIQVADSGKRIARESSDHRGVYFAAAEEIPTYAELGQIIGRSLGRNRVRNIRGPIPVIWALAAVNDCISRLRGRPHILSLDKVREARAGSWTCNGNRLRRETAFEFQKSLQERIDETARWYIDQGWI